LAANNSYRVVSACFKIRYIGREDAMGGTMTWCEQADHISLAANTVGALRDRSTSLITPVSREWQQLNYSGPVAPVDLDFITNTDNSKALPFMACLINAAVVAESLTFEWEAHINVEVIGVAALGKTPSHSDPVGFARVASAVKASTVDSAFNLNSAVGVVSSLYSDYSKGGVSGLAKTAVKAIGSDLLSGYSSSAIKLALMAS